MPNPKKRDPREPTPGAEGLPAEDFEKMMGDLEGGIKARGKKKKKKAPAQKPLSVSSALKREEEKGSGVTKPAAALRNAAASRAKLGK